MSDDTCTRCGQTGHRASHCQWPVAAATKPDRSTRPVPVSYNPNAPRCGAGVYDLDDIRSRCWVDDVTGCWHWSMALNSAGWNRRSLTPYVSLPAGVLEGLGRRTMSVPRAVWLMTGRTLRQDWVVWRTCTCDDCVSPAHLKAGTKADEGAWARRSGHLRGSPGRAAANIRTVAEHQAYSREQVQQVEQQLAAGRMQKDLAAELGIHKATISKIARGKHLHQRGVLVRGASVFNLAEVTA